MIKEKIDQAVKEKKLLPSAQQNIHQLLELENCPKWILNSLDELVTGELWEELNDRFHTNLAFGTGGMRGRTIGKVVTNPEQGNST